MLPLNLRWLRSPAVLVVLFSLLAMLLLLALTAPWLLWAYNVEQAGRLLEQGTQWPDKRQVETVPQASDAQAIEAALGHLAAAMRWRDGNEQAYWTAGRAYMAQAAWPRAAEALTQARERAPDNPLLAWETGLVYEQMVAQVAQAPQTGLVSSFASGVVEAPPAPVQTPFCGDAPGSCYVGETVFTQPLAAFPAGAPLSAPTLFLHAPAKVRQQLTLPEGQPALSFLLGLDPNAREWGSDGASFQLWVEPADAPATLLFERTLDGAAARAGWSAEWADLTPWAGQTVTLALVTGPGPAGNADADWYGWGNLVLTTVEAAQIAARAPQAQLAEAWQQGGFNASYLFARGNRDLYQQRYDEARAWYERAALVEPVASSYWYHRSLLAQAQGDAEAASAALEEAARLDQGWMTGEVFSKAHLLLGIERYTQERYDEAREVLLPNTTLNRDDPALRPQIAESFRYLGLIQQQGGDLAGAVASLQQARELKADDPRIQFQYGRALYGLDPQRADEVAQAFDAALALRPADASLWQNAIAFWQQVGEGARATALCQRAEAPDLAAALSDLCASP